MLPIRLVSSLLLALAPIAALLTACGSDGNTKVDATDANEVDASDVVEVDASDVVQDVAPSYAAEFTVVELDSGAPKTLEMAVRACAGMKNRELGGSVYIEQDGHDAQWLVELGLEPSEVVDATAFLDACVAELPACVRYSYADQQELMPSILTAAAALEALPLDVGMSAACGEVVLDATVELADRNTPYLATEYAYEHYLALTTGLAMLDPGYDVHDPDPANPALTGEMSSAMVDFVFSQKLFVVFLNKGCIDSEPEHDLLQTIVDESGWPTPLGVYGYNNSWLVGGYLYEAQTRCLDSRNMGAIPTSTGNLSFFSTRRPPIRDASELQRNDPEEIAYDPSKTYVAFVVGDGDNVRFIMSTRNVWLGQRLADCEKADNSCAPLTWSISPHLARIAPDVLAWYFEKTSRTGNDYFILPPSGHLYAYPTSLNAKDQDRFVSATEDDARILGAHGTVHWDWFESWGSAEDDFLPKYASTEGVIQGIFPVNVPYMLEAFPSWPSHLFYKVLAGEDGGEVAVFRPREWRGVDDSGSGGDKPFYLSPQNMADELAGYPAGTVSWVYMTSDGGLSLENSFMALVKLLPDHVRLVGADTAARLALEANRN